MCRFDFSLRKKHESFTFLSDRICTNSQSHESIFAGKHGKIVR